MLVAILNAVWRAQRRSANLSGKRDITIPNRNESSLGRDNAEQDGRDEKRHAPEPKDLGGPVIKSLAFFSSCILVLGFVEICWICSSGSSDSVVPRTVPVIIGKHDGYGDRASDRAQTQDNYQNKHRFDATTRIRPDHDSRHGNESRLNSGDHSADAVNGGEAEIFVTPFFFCAP